MSAARAASAADATTRHDSIPSRPDTEGLHHPPPRRTRFPGHPAAWSCTIRGRSRRPASRRRDLTGAAERNRACDDDGDGVQHLGVPWKSSSAITASRRPRSMTTFRTRRSRGGWQVLEPPVVESPVEAAERPRAPEPGQPAAIGEPFEHAPPAARRRTPRGGQPWKSAPLWASSPDASTAAPVRVDPRSDTQRATPAARGSGPLARGSGSGLPSAPSPRRSPAERNREQLQYRLGIDVTGYRCVLVGTAFGRRAEQRQRRGARVGGQTQCTLAS